MLWGVLDSNQPSEREEDAGGLGREPDLADPPAVPYEILDQSCVGATFRGERHCPPWWDSGRADEPSGPGQKLQSSHA